MTIGMPARMRGLSVVSISRVTPNTLSERDTIVPRFFCAYIAGKISKLK